MSKPNRAKMCNWVAQQLRGITTMPNNPADIQRMAQLAKVNDRKIRHLTTIVAEMGWHADASLDLAMELIEEYDDEFARKTVA